MKYTVHEQVHDNGWDGRWQRDFERMRCVPVSDHSRKAEAIEAANRSDTRAVVVRWHDQATIYDNGKQPKETGLPVR